jgi:phosphoribosylamine--glycine ligase
MKTLIIGSGGREHAIAWALSRSSIRPAITCAPGNGGTALLGKNVDIKADAIAEMTDFVRDQKFDLVIVGPDDPIAAGMGDSIAKYGCPVFSPSAAAAKIESSKAFAKQLMVEAGIPTASYEVFTNLNAALDYLKIHGAPVVVKASGLALGKGAVVCLTLAEAIEMVTAMLGKGVFGEAGKTVVIEDYLEGRELSVTAICDGLDYLLLPPSRDHKRALDGDKGLNTGGMGVVSPPHDIPDNLYDSFGKSIIEPVLKTLADRGTPFRGTLYPGVMVGENDFHVLEFNARFGDPETQALLPLLNVDFLELIGETANGNLSGWKRRSGVGSCGWKSIANPLSAVTVVVASGGYPGSYRKGVPITNLPADAGDMIVFHAGTKRTDAGFVTNGGRVLAVTGLGADFTTASNRAYGAVEEVSFDGSFYRHDIGRTIIQ